MRETLALLGGTPVITTSPPVSLFKWPIVTKEDEEAALDVIRTNNFSGTDITMRLEEEFAAWLGVEHAVAYCNGTLSLAAAMFAVGLGAGDEIICTTKTYWASVAQAMQLGAVPVFCNIDTNLSMDPNDLERCITPRTKAIMVVHYCAYPADMDAIMDIARRHGLLVIEDVSHAQGGLYKGKRLGTFGDVAAMSLMSGKSFAAGELGMLVTNERKYYERALAYAHYERNNEQFITQSEELKPYFNIPLGGVKGRANQLCSALARGQLKYYDERCKVIRRAMNRFWDMLEGLPGIHPIRVDESEGSNMAGWYNPHGYYCQEALDGLSVDLFCEAVRAELGAVCYPGGNKCLHTHELFQTFDFLKLGRPSRVAFTDADARTTDMLCERSETVCCFSVPWFKQDDGEWIARYAEGYKKVLRGYKELLALENARKEKQGGRWYGTVNT